MGIMLFVRNVLVHVNKLVGVKENKAKVGQSTGICINIGCFFIGYIAFESGEYFFIFERLSGKLLYE